MNFLLLVIPTLVSGRILFPFEIEELQRRGGFSASAITFSSSETTTEPSETATTTMNIDTTTISGEDMQETTTPSELIAICPDGDFWCDTPLEYPDRAILKAVNKQKRTFKEMFDTKVEKENFAMSENETLISTRNNFVEYEVSAGVQRPQARHPGRVRGGARGGHLQLPLLLHLPHRE